MVPEVDKKDTHAQLDAQRTQLEAIRQEILSWQLPREQTRNDAEAQAIRKLASRSAQQARQWTGRMLKELSPEGYPYPNSSDASTQTIDKSTVPTEARLLVGSGAEITVVQRIKHVRALTSRITGELEELAANCIPGSFFNQCLFKVQEHAVQTGMWLGELLGEFFDAQPKVEAEAPKNEAPSTTTDSSTDTTHESDTTTSELSIPTVDSSSPTESTSETEASFTLSALKEVVAAAAANITPEQAAAVVENNQHVPAFAEAVAQGNDIASTTAPDPSVAEASTSSEDVLSPNGNVIKKSAKSARK